LSIINIPAMKNNHFKKHKGFTLLELLVVIAVAAVLVTIVAFGLTGARESARDGRRRADLESIRGALEFYRSDCGRYPAAVTFGSPLVGSGTPARCSSSNTYLRIVPADPVSGRNYIYSVNGSGTTYEICASLEAGGTTVSCGGNSTCGSGTCNYRVLSP
jgi:general secretion pathway protein G